MFVLQTEISLRIKCIKGFFLCVGRATKTDLSSRALKKILQKHLLRFKGARFAYNRKHLDSLIILAYQLIYGSCQKVLTRMQCLSVKCFVYIDVIRLYKSETKQNSMGSF